MPELNKPTTTSSHWEPLADLLSETNAVFQDMRTGMSEMFLQLQANLSTGSQADELPNMLRDRTFLLTTNLAQKATSMAAELRAPALGRYGGEPYAIEGKRFLDLTLADALAPVEPLISDVLVNPSARESIKQLLGHISILASRSVLLEYRLKENQPQVDVSVLLDPQLDRGREILAGKTTPQLDSAFTSHPAWARIQTFCAAWAERGSLLNQNIETCWLEFDLAGRETDHVPSLFFNLHPTLNAPAETVIRTAFEILGASAEAMPHLEQALDAMEEGFRVRWAGVMLPRDAGNPRLCLELAKDQIKPYLEQLGWAGNVEQLDTLIAGFTVLADSLVLAIELNAQGLHPRLGFECRYDKNRQPENEPRWARMMDTLVRAKLTTPDKANAFIQSNGMDHWPMPHLPKAQVLQRLLSHVKLSYESNVALEAKGYSVVSWRDIDKEKFIR